MKITENNYEKTTMEGCVKESILYVAYIQQHPKFNFLFKIFGWDKLNEMIVSILYCIKCKGKNPVKDMYNMFLSLHDNFFDAIILTLIKKDNNITHKMILENLKHS